MYNRSFFLWGSVGRQERKMLRIFAKIKILDVRNEFFNYLHAPPSSLNNKHCKFLQINLSSDAFVVVIS